MSKYRKGMLYVRRLNPKDKAGSYITALQMAAKSMLSHKFNRRPPFVLVRYGYRGMDVMDVGDSRADLLSRINGGMEPFRDISRRFRDERPSVKSKGALSGGWNGVE